VIAHEPSPPRRPGSRIKLETDYPLNLFHFLIMFALLLIVGMGTAFSASPSIFLLLVLAGPVAVGAVLSLIGHASWPARLWGHTWMTAVSAGWCTWIGGGAVVLLVSFLVM